MKVVYGGHWLGCDVPEFTQEQEYDLTLEQLEKLTDAYAVKFHLIKVVDPSKNQPTQYVKYFFLDDQKWSFKQR